MPGVTVVHVPGHVWFPVDVVVTHEDAFGRPGSSERRTLWTSQDVSLMAVGPFDRARAVFLDATGRRLMTLFCEHGEWRHAEPPAALAPR